MVERVAAAIRAKCAELEHRDGGKENIRDADAMWFSEDYARAAIAAMREPSVDMVDAGVDDYPGEGLKASGCLSAQAIWEAMVDAAMPESP